MSLPKSELLYTEAEYLALERESEERHEYLDGQIYLMAGESPAHGDIGTIGEGRKLCEHEAARVSGNAQGGRPRGGGYHAGTT